MKRFFQQEQQQQRQLLRGRGRRTSTVCISLVVAAVSVLSLFLRQIRVLWTAPEFSATSASSGSAAKLLFLFRDDNNDSAEQQLPVVIMRNKNNNNINNNHNHNPQPPRAKEEEEEKDVDRDRDCIFRNSSLYRKVFVYPTYGDVDDGWQGDILSDYTRRRSNSSNNNASTLMLPWPWLAIDQRIRANEQEQYAPYSMTAQFATELLVRDIFTHPASCLRTYNPEQADLFYIPYLPSVEFHAGVRGKPPSHKTSPYAQAILDALHGDYTGWERWFGWTSTY